MLIRNQSTVTRRRSLTIFLCACIVFCGTAYADPRYDVVPLHPGYEFGTEKALILDTVAGHMWIWVESPSVGKHEGGRYVIYQGQLVPGRRMGEVILQQEWPPDKK